MKIYAFKRGALKTLNDELNLDSQKAQRLLLGGERLHRTLLLAPGQNGLGKKGCLTSSKEASLGEGSRGENSCS